MLEAEASVKSQKILVSMKITVYRPWNHFPW